MAGTHEFTHFNNIIKSSQRGSKPLRTIISLFVTHANNGDHQSRVRLILPADY